MTGGEYGGLSEHFLVDDNQDEQDENSDDSTGYEALLVHPKVQRNLELVGGRIRGLLTGCTRTVESSS